MPIDDREYAVIVPKYDNSGRRIKTDEIEDIATRMSDRFGGTTITPSVLGCWQPDDQDALMCEENVKVASVRDSNDQTDPQEDEQWMEDLAEDVGDEFGQFSVLTTTDVIESDFVEGDFKETLGDDKVGQQPFDKLI